MGRDQPQLPDFGFERVGAHDRVDTDGRREHLADAGALLGRGEVGLDPGGDRFGGADVERAVVGCPEHVDAGSVGQAVGEVALAALGRCDGLGELDRVADGVDAEAPEAGEQRVQHVNRGASVVERSVARHPGVEERRERGQLPIGHLVSRQRTTGDRQRVEHPGLRPRVTEFGARRFQEADVIGRVVGDPDGVTSELQERRQRLFELGRGRDHRLGDAGQHGHERRDRQPRVDQGAEFAHFLAAAHLHRADLGDAAVVGHTAGRLEVDDDERGLPQRAGLGMRDVQRRLGVTLGGHGAQPYGPGTTSSPVASLAVISFGPPYAARAGRVRHLAHVRLVISRDSHGGTGAEPARARPGAG